MTAAPDAALATPVQHEWIPAVAAALLGLAFWPLLFDPAILNPTNVDWLLVEGDRGVNYLGWAFFRDTPWDLPPGINPRYGLELSSSIVYSDSVPLFAIVFKLLGPLLPAEFQYLGLWTLICMMLQGLFGFLLARRLGASVAAALVVSGFCLAAPVLAARLAHLALTAHWTLLAAFWLYFGKTTRPAAWVLLLAVVAAIHPYLLGMVLPVFGADLVKRYLLKTAGAAPLIAEAGLAVAVSVAVMWITGVFTGASPGTGGFGYYKQDLLSLIDSNQRFSQLLPDIPNGGGAYEGYGFLGFGVLVLGLAALPAARLRGALDPAIWPLLAAVAAMFLFSLSNAVDVAGVRILLVPLPELLDRAVGIFRSSGRFVWPAVYLLTVFIVLAVTRHYPRAGTLLATACLGLQLLDMGPGLASAREKATVLPQPPEAISPLWAKLAEQYPRVRAIPVKHPGYEWAYASRAALGNGMSTGSVYLARVPPLDESKRAADEVLNTGAFDAGAVYILDDAARDAAAKQARPGDLMTVIDGRTIFAREGCTKVPDLCPSMSPEPQP